MPVEVPEPVAVSTNTTANATESTGKRKRGESSEAAAATAMDGLSLDEKASRRKAAIEAIAKDLLLVLTEYDPTPSILTYSLSSIASLESQTPPSKRTKLSTPIPDTIKGRLSAVTYSSFNVFLSDVSVICGALMNTLNSMPRANSVANGSTSWENVNTTIARVIHFEQLAKDLVNRQRKRLAHVLDLTEEIDTDEKAANTPDTVALTVLTYGGPMFSSLPKPDKITIPSAASSRSTSASGSPKSPASTAATSMSDWTKAKAESLSVVTPFIESAMRLPPLISTVKAISVPDTTLKKEAAAKVPKMGEAFPTPPALLHLQSPPVDYSKIGLKWGGDVGPGGVVVHPEIEYKTEVAGHWLQYTNFPQPGLSRLMPDPFRQGIGLPSNFVAAYSSFAPTRDESFAKLPAALNDAIWWERRGGRIFRKMFGDDPGVGHMFTEYEPKKRGDVVVSTSSDELDEKELENLIENFEDLPIDTRLLMDSDTALAEISSLLQTLQSQQYRRLAALPKPGEAPRGPGNDEVKTYMKLRDRLAFLTASLPPHILATIDGHPDSDLILSSKIPILTGGPPVFKGTLPADDLPKPPQIQAAAMTAMNAAAGLSPINPAPIANMMGSGPGSGAARTPQRLQGTPHVTVGVPPPQGTTPHHYPSPYNSAQYSQGRPPPPPPPQFQQPQQQQRPPTTPQYQQRPRGSVPPPQGLGAIGVGGGYYQQRMPVPSPVPSQQGETRYSQRTRR